MGRLRRKAIYEAMPFSGPHGFLTGGCELTALSLISNASQLTLQR